MFLTCGMLKVMDYFNSVIHDLAATDFFKCGVLNVMDYYNYVMHNSQALDFFDMWSVKKYGLLQLGEAYIASTGCFCHVECYKL